MSRRTAHRAAAAVVFVFAFIATGWLLLWINSNVPASTVIVWVGAAGAVVVAGIAVMLLTAGHHMDPFAPSPGTAQAVCPDEHMRPLRTGRADATSPAAPSPSVLSLAGSEEMAAPTVVPGRECVASHSPAGDLARHRHRKPPARRQKACAFTLQPAVAYMTAPPPDSPARETPAPGSEGLRLEGQEPATGNEDVTVLCAGCLGFSHCDGIEGGCDCTCGLPADWAGDGDYEPTPAEDAYMAEHHPVAMLTVGPAENDSERPGTPANTREQHERLAHTGELLLAAVPDVAHEAPEESEADAEDVPMPVLPSLPGDQDDPGPLYSDDTAWHNFTALKNLAPEAEVAS